MRILFPLLLLSCQTGDKGVVVFDNAPSASILSPQNYAVYNEGESITFQGVVDDDSPLEEDCLLKLEGFSQTSHWSYM